FVKELALCAVRKPLERDRTIPQVRQKIFRNPDVVIDHLAFAVRARSVQNLIEVADGDFPAFDSERLRFASHQAARRSRLFLRTDIMSTTSPPFETSPSASTTSFGCAFSFFVAYRSSCSERSSCVNARDSDL